MRRSRCCDLPTTDSAVAARDAVEVSPVDDALPSASNLAVHGNLAHAMTNAHAAGGDRYSNALANKFPRHGVAVCVDLDRAVVADNAAQLAQTAERWSTTEWLQAMYLIACIPTGEVGFLKKCKPSSC